ncbi:helix-turn-helix transcriptional regulator [Embleya sp. NPDC050154]|uniref:helix-turn-helix transcriptional regulator n=1 Tax=Embleya sp. NPDC050154 TaxID=3363988 RepID=UPI0037944A90
MLRPCARGRSASAARCLRPASGALCGRRRGHADTVRRESDPQSPASRQSGTRGSGPVERTHLPDDVRHAHHPGAHPVCDRRSSRRPPGRCGPGLRSAGGCGGCGRSGCRTSLARAARRRRCERSVCGIGRRVPGCAPADPGPAGTPAGPRTRGGPGGRRRHARPDGRAADAGRHRRRSTPERLPLHPRLPGGDRRTPHRFLTRLRIERARQLPADGTLTIGQIAERCGFASPGALSAAFLSRVGVRPSVYRNTDR